MTSNSKNKMLYFLDHMAGDKVVWIILLMLMLLSILFIFSSSSKLTSSSTTRVDIMIDHLKIVGISLAAVIVIYNIKDIDFFKKLSQWGFVISVMLLITLMFKGERTNGAIRYFTLGGYQIHVLEMVKIAMMMYFAWAINMIETGAPALLEKIPKLREKLRSKEIKRIVYLYVPFVVTVVLVQRSSNTTALLMALLMIITVAVGAGEVKQALILSLICLGLALGLFSIYNISKARGDNPPKCERVGTAIGRIVAGDLVKKYHEAPSGEKQAVMDRLRQPYSARLAIHQGKVLGKGPGQSTQRYVVPDMPEDYMFSFIVEEYGWLSFFVITLYLSLLARGTLIIKNCANDLFAKSAIFSLVLLISGQAFIHIFVNMDFGILTGQTLPLLSHGSFAFLCFSIAFGIILSISRMANKGMEKASKNAEPILVSENNDTISEGLSDLDDFESDELQTD